MSIFDRKRPVAAVAAILSVYTVIAFHFPFFKHLVAQLDGGFNGVVIFMTALLLLLLLDFLLYYILLCLGRFVGKCIIAFTLFGDAVMLYFVNNYEVLITDEMMGNTVNTQFSEASGFFSFAFVLYVLLLCVVPCIFLFKQKIDYGSWKRFLATLGICVASMAALIFGNMKNWTWIDRNSTELGSLLAPWSYIVNTIRYYDGVRKANVKETLLPDPVSVSPTRDVCVLFIGESVRRDRCSLYGYEKETNPLMRADSVKAYVANSEATYTSAGVRAILEPWESSELNEILPNYLLRHGVDVIWRTNNWGEPPVNTPKYYTFSALKERYPEADSRYDGLLLEGLREEIEGSDSTKVFVVIHAYTNHGPAYDTNYPDRFRVFLPVCNTVEMSKTSKEELDNAYDNSILYTDYLVHSVIETLRAIPTRRSMLLFVSDHGESLGENNLYMHGVPLSMAPKEQLEIPFVVWASDNSSLRYKDLPRVSQYFVYHSILRFYGMDAPFYEEEKCVFLPEN